MWVGARQREHLSEAQLGGSLTGARMGGRALLVLEKGKQKLSQGSSMCVRSQERDNPAQGKN